MSLVFEFMETEQLIRAVYLTLLHSFWQGAAIAGIVGIIIMSAKNLSSSTRYNFLAGSMVFFVLCTAITFIKYLTASSESPTAYNTTATYTALTEQTGTVNTLDQIFSVLNSYSNSIVLFWFAIICLKSLQLSLGLHRVSNLKTKRTVHPGTGWVERVNHLSAKMGIRSVVKFAESGLTSIPLTVGYLKPVILVPLGMLAAIPAGQVEAILLHELAHVKRQDYFINIFQSLVDVFFFFNPAIWWLSALLRAERENCCDDLAIAHSSSKTHYVRALVSFEEYRTQHPRLAVAFSGSENTLLQRTKRIIYNQNETLNPMEKFILASGLVVSGLLSLAFTDGAKEQISKTIKPVVSTISETFPTVEKAFAAFADTIPASSIREVSIINGGATTFNAVHKGKTYKIVMKDDQVTDLYVDYMKIAKEKVRDYTQTIIEIIEFAKAMKISAEDEKRAAIVLAPPVTEVVFASPITEVVLTPPITEVVLTPPVTEVVLTPPVTEVVLAPAVTEVVFAPPHNKVVPASPVEPKKPHSGTWVTYSAEDSVVSDIQNNKVILYGKDKVIEITTRDAKASVFRAVPTKSSTEKLAEEVEAASKKINENSKLKTPKAKPQPAKKTKKTPVKADPSRLMN